MSPKRILFLPVLCLAVGALAIAGCGSSSSNSSSNSSSSPTPASTGASTSSSASSGGTSASSAKGVSVSMKNIQFNPAKINAKVGQTITWTNDDSVQHDVTAMSGAKFRSSLVPAGGTYKFKVTKPGVIKYVCTIHPGMNGEIDVTK